METFVDVLNSLLPVAYLAAVLAYGLAFFRQNKVARRIKTALLDAAIGFHLLYLVLRTVAFDHPPITTVFEIMSIVAFSIAGAYRLIEQFTRVKNTGFFILTMSLFFQTLSTLLIQHLYHVSPILRSVLLGIHVTNAMLGLSAFAISAVYGLLYLLQYHNLKRARFGLVYERLPNLESLEKMTMTSVVAGFFLLTLAIGFGAIWLSHSFTDVPYFDPKLVGTVLIWLIYGAGIVAKTTFSWQGRRMMVLSIFGFLISFLSMTIVNMYSNTFHKFH